MQQNLALEMKWELDYREKFKPIMIPLDKGREEVQRDYDTCSKFVYDLKDNVNPVSCDTTRHKYTYAKILHTLGYIKVTYISYVLSLKLHYARVGDLGDC